MKQTNPVWRYGGFVFSAGGARLTGVFITSLTFPYLVRHLGIEMYGLWSYVVAVCAFLDNVADPGLSTYLIQQVASRRLAAFELVPDIVAIRLLSSSLAVVLVFAVSRFETHADIRRLFLFYGAGFFLTNLIGCEQLLGAMEMFHARSLLTVTQQAMYAAGIFLFVRSQRDILWLPGSILTSVLLTNIVGWVLLRRRGVRLGRTVTFQRWKGILTPSAHYAVSSLMADGYRRTGHIVVRWFLGEHALGLYAAATRLVEILHHLLHVVLNVMMPRMAISAKSEPGFTRLAHLATSVVALTSIPLAVGLFSTAHLLVPLVMGHTYLEDIALVRWMSAYLITAPAAMLLSGTILYAMGRHRAYTASMVGGALAGVGLYLTLIPAMGLTGAGLAFVLAELAVAVIAGVLLPSGLHDLWKNRLIGVAVLAALLMAAIVKAVNLRTSRPLLVVSAGIFVYVLATAWFVKKWLIAQARVSQQAQA